MNLSDAASLISIVVGVIAIALAVVFYRWSSEKSAAMDGAVNRLEDIVGRLYSDLFGEYRTTMSDIRKHLFRGSVEPDPEVEARANEEMKALEERMEQKLSQVLDKQDSSHEAVMGVLREALPEARQVDKRAREDLIESRILEELKGSSDGVTAADLMANVSRSEKCKDTEVAGALFELAERGLVTWDGPRGRFHPRQTVRLSPS